MPIETLEQYEDALDTIAAIDDAPPGSNAERELSALVAEVEAYERRHDDDAVTHYVICREPIKQTRFYCPQCKSLVWLDLDEASNQVCAMECSACGWRFGVPSDEDD